MKYFIFVITFFSILQGQSQESNPYLDSLKNELLHNHHDTINADILLYIGEGYDYINADSAKHYFEACISLCDKAIKINPFNAYYEHKSDALSGLGYIYGDRGEVSKTIEYYHKSLSLDSLSNNYENSATTLDNIGIQLYKIGKIEESIDFANKALKLREQRKDQYGIANSFNNIGYIYHNHVGNLDIGLEYYKKSLQIFITIDNKEGQSHLLNNIGFVYWQKNQDSIARVYYDKSLKIAKDIGSSDMMISPLTNIAELYNSVENYDTSLIYFTKILQVSIDNKYVFNEAFVLNNLAWTYYYMGNYNKAIEMANKALILANAHDYKAISRNSNKVLYESYNKKGDQIKAFRYFKDYITIRDSLTSKSSLSKALSSQYQYEYEKNALADSLKNYEQARIKAIEHKQKLTKQRGYTYIGLVGFLIMIIISGLIFRSYKQKRKANLVIASQKVEVEEQRDIANEQKLIVEEKNKEILDSITYAKRIQEAILPPPRLVKEWLTESFIFYKPKDIVAGDFYWMETATYTENTKEKTLVYFAAADCTGHGVPGAMVSVVCANALNRAIKEFNLIEPGQVLDKVSELVVESFDKGDAEIKDGMDIALCALDISAKKVFYSGANNPLYRITTNTENINPELKTETNDTHQLIEYKANKQPIGHNKNALQFNTIEIQLEPGDAIYVFSDGFPDQFGGEKGKKYKYSTFRKSLLANFHHPMETQKQLLEKEFDHWKGDLEQIDDVCIIGVKINGVEKNNFTKRELEVLLHLQEGLPSKLIADKMFISKHTVDTYRRRLLAKTGTYNSTELINYCIKKEII